MAIHTVDFCCSYVQSHTVRVSRGAILRINGVEIFSFETKSVCFSNVLLDVLASVCVLSDKLAFVIWCSLLIKYQTWIYVAFDLLLVTDVTSEIVEFH